MNYDEWALVSGEFLASDYQYQAKVDVHRWMLKHHVYLSLYEYDMQSPDEQGIYESGGAVDDHPARVRVYLPVYPMKSHQAQVLRIHQHC